MSRSDGPGEGYDGRDGFGDEDGYDDGDGDAWVRDDENGYQSGVGAAGEHPKSDHSGGGVGAGGARSTSGSAVRRRRRCGAVCGGSGAAIGRVCGVAVRAAGPDLDPVIPVQRSGAGS